MEGTGARFAVVPEQHGLVLVQWAPAIVLRDSDGASLTAEVQLHRPGHRVHLLMFLNGMTSLSQDALAYFAKRAPLSAVALVGPSILDQPLIELYVEVYHPPYPVEYFEREGPARDWLLRQPTLGAPGPGAR
ncbi:hypothetical protein [Arthrobacter sp. B1805]|uniref:DUF7793 family protein n=1 Tax=Arthrobacter sp. B1805 TaxID=2058892 RepID=UPI000CE39999|nr:hypothetical protein [Arthrobacter sp. B1805]